MEAKYPTVVFLLLCLYMSCTTAKSIPDKPHILFILADDFGWADVGYHSNKISTPTLDSLAAEGVKLESYYVQPTCTPTRSQLLCGKYQIHTGLQHGNIEKGEPVGLPLECTTIADKLQEAGYWTAMAGKWHLGTHKWEYTPTYRGFDEFYGFHQGSEGYFSHEGCAGDNCGLDLYDMKEPDHSQGGIYSSHLFAGKAQQMVAQHSKSERSDQPLFMYLSFQATHGPLEVPDGYADPEPANETESQWSRRTFIGMVRAMDEAIKNVTDTFKEYGLWDNTVLIFSTDNGGNTNLGSSNWPLFGGKGSLWEGGTRGVGFVRSGLLEKTGYENTEMLHVSDWYPTLMSLAGLETDLQGLDGYNVWDTISKNAPSPRQEILINIDPLKDPYGPEMFSEIFDTRVYAAMRLQKWKLLTGSNCEKKKPDPEKNFMLFNIEEDPNEETDVSEKYPEIVELLLWRLHNYNLTAVTPLVEDIDPNSYPKYHDGVWTPWL